jgi:hypothetical protein
MIVVVIHCIRVLAFDLVCTFLLDIQFALSEHAQLTDNVSRIRESVHANRAGWLDGHSYLLCNACIGQGTAGTPPHYRHDPPAEGVVNAPTPPAATPPVVDHYYGFCQSQLAVAWSLRCMHSGVLLRADEVMELVAICCTA